MCHAMKIHELALSLSATYLLTFFIFFAINKIRHQDVTIKKRELASAPWSFLVDISNHKIFIAFQILLGLSYSFLISKTQVITASLISIFIISTGLIMKLSGKLEGCNCYGENIASGKITTTLSIISLLLAFLLLFIEITNNASMPYQGIYGILFLPFMFLLQGSAKVKNAKIESGNPIPMPELQEDTILGLDQNNAIVRLGDYPREKPIFIVQVSEECQLCKKLVPDLLKMAEAFSQSVSFCFIYKQHAALSQNHTSVADHDSLFFKSLNTTSYPSAALIHGESLKLMAPVAIGPARIRFLFALMLNANEQTTPVST